MLNVVMLNVIMLSFMLPFELTLIGESNTENAYKCFQLVPWYCH